MPLKASRAEFARPDLSPYTPLGMVLFLNTAYHAGFTPSIPFHSAYDYYE
jgi:hypothetical protein